MQTTTATTATISTTILVARARLFDAYNRREGAEYAGHSSVRVRANLAYDAARKAWRRAGGVGTALGAVCDEDDYRVEAQNARRPLGW